ncbi:MAG: matrixin family metalloprotease [Bacteriovorax sp.]|nr:matrixin family metalloprotease [Bacteriovorax sp.]
MKSLCLAFLTSFMISLKADAFTLNNSGGLIFGKNEVSVHVANGNCANIGIDENELLLIVGNAVDQYWNQSPTSRLKLRKGSLQNLSSAYKTDAICTNNSLAASSDTCTPNTDLSVSSDILITCNDNASNFSSSGVLAVTVPNNIVGNSIIGSLIMINDSSSNQFKLKSYDEKVSIIAHEIGHAFGLGHSPVKDSLMYYSTVDMRKNLGFDDIDGISYLYPKQQPISCGSITEKTTPNSLTGMIIGLLLASFIRYQLRYLKLRPRF